jgi:DNA-binding transcriptional LysR family regulator
MRSHSAKEVIELPDRLEEIRPLVQHNAFRPRAHRRIGHLALIRGRDFATALDALPRLHRRQNPDAWHRYAEEAGGVLTNPAIGPRYDLHSMQIEAALAGLGVALVPRLYIESELTEGRLVAPWPDGVSISKTFCLILPESIRLSDAPIQVFAN